MTLPLQNGARSAGRLIVTRHMAHELPVLVAACCGFPQGPTWPDSKALNRQLLASLTKEIVVGCAGPRLIAGDFNCDSVPMEEFRVWESYGWSEIQIHANKCWQRPIAPKCKGSTVVDMIWMSPEAVALCRNVDNVNLSPDHTTLYADFYIPAKVTKIKTWPRLTPITWDHIDLDHWHDNLVQHPPPDSVGSETTAFFTNWAQHCESALDGCVKDQPQRGLPQTCRGRAQRTKPMLADITPPMQRASRPGEVQLSSDLI